jgi:hypothetical protein
MNLAPLRYEFDSSVRNVTCGVHDNPPAPATINACKMCSRTMRHVNSLSRDRLCFSCQAWREECKLIDLKLELCRAYAFGFGLKAERQPKDDARTQGH